MATEKRLIRADVTVEAFTKWLTSRYDGRMPADIVDEIPTCDAVEVVRCKDCSYHRDYEGNTTGKVICKRFSTFREPDFYCAYGERRTDGR